MVHTLLQHQLEKAFGSVAAVPRELDALIAELDAACQGGQAPAADGERALLQVSFEIASRRLTEAIRQLQAGATERERLKERLNASERLASLGTLSAGVSHEINNPLAFISANLTFLIEALSSGTPLDLAAREECLAAVTDVRTGTDRIAKIVHNLRLFSTPGALGTQAVDVRQVIRLAVDLLAGALSSRAKVTCEFGAVSLVPAEGARLGQVFLHLLRNALQSITEGAYDQNEVRVVSRMHQGQVVVEVFDTGRGIGAEALTRVFEPFVSPREVGEGQGLGLSICHGIVTSLGGTIEAQSEPGRGSVFRVRLPAVGDVLPG